MYPRHDDVGHAGRILSAATTGPLSLKEVTYAPGTSESRHEHPFGSVILTLSGRLRAQLASGSSPHGPGSVRFVPPGEPHGNRYETGVHTFVVGIDETALRRAGPALQGAGTRTFGDGALPTLIASRIFHEFKAHDVAWELAVEGLTWELFVAITRDAVRPRERAAPKWIQEVRDEVRASFRERVRLTSLARRVGVHPAHLGRTFQRQYGCSLATFVRELRLEAARQALAADDRPVAQIAAQHGFADQSQFTRAFRERYGMTPARYRAAAKPRDRSNTPLATPEPRSK